MKHTLEESEKNAMRLLKCAKACADIANPAAIPEVVDALKLALAYPTYGDWCEKARTSLANLERGEQ